MILGPAPTPLNYEIFNTKIPLHRFEVDYLKRTLTFKTQDFPLIFIHVCLNFQVAGGLPAGMGILECVKKECKEEASLSGKLLDKLQFTGTVR